MSAAPAAGSAPVTVTTEHALAFIREHGVVLASGKGPVPRLADIIAGETIKGSWWSHPQSHQIFAVFQALDHSPEILVCRLVGGKITFVHQRLWPALVRAAGHFPPQALARTHQEHTAAGHHVSRNTAFPDWVPAETQQQASLLDEQAALSALGAWAAGNRARG